MHRAFLSNALAMAVLAAPVAAQSPQEIPARYRDVANRIIAAAQADSMSAWNRIA